MVSISGIYQIKNSRTNKIYIGSAINFKSRWQYHKRDLKANKHCNKYLQAAWNKYKEDAFLFSIIEEVLPENLISREQYYLDLYKPYGKIGYNICRVAGSSFGIKHTDKAKAKISKANLGSIRGVSPFKGTVLSEERKNKMSKAHQGKTHSIETRLKMSLSTVGKVKTKEHADNIKRGKLGKSNSKTNKGIVRLTKDFIFIESFESIKLASLKYTFSSGSICTCCKNPKYTYKNSRWMYAEDYKELVKNQTDEK